MRLAGAAPSRLAAGLRQAATRALPALRGLRSRGAAVLHRMHALGAKAAGSCRAASKAALGWLMQPAPTFEEVTRGQLMAVAAASCLALAAAYTAGLATAEVSARRAGSTNAVQPTLQASGLPAPCSCPPALGSPDSHAMPTGTRFAEAEQPGASAPGPAEAGLRGTASQQQPAAAAPITAEADLPAPTAARGSQPAHSGEAGNGTAE